MSKKYDGWVIRLMRDMLKSEEEYRPNMEKIIKSYPQIKDYK